MDNATDRYMYYLVMGDSQDPVNPTLYQIESGAASGFWQCLCKLLALPLDQLTLATAAAQRMSHFVLDFAIISLTDGKEQLALKVIDEEDRQDTRRVCVMVSGEVEKAVVEGALPMLRSGHQHGKILIELGYCEPGEDFVIVSDALYPLYRMMRARLLSPEWPILPDHYAVSLFGDDRSGVIYPTIWENIGGLSWQDAVIRLLQMPLGLFDASRARTSQTHYYHTAVVREERPGRHGQPNVMSLRNPDTDSVHYATDSRYLLFDARLLPQMLALGLSPSDCIEHPDGYYVQIGERPSVGADLAATPALAGALAHLDANSDLKPENKKYKWIDDKVIFKDSTGILGGKRCNCRHQLEGDDFLPLLAQCFIERSETFDQGQARKVGEGHYRRSCWIEDASGKRLAAMVREKEAYPMASRGVYLALDNDVLHWPEIQALHPAALRHFETLPAITDQHTSYFKVASFHKGQLLYEPQVIPFMVSLSCLAIDRLLTRHPDRLLSPATPPQPVSEYLLEVEWQLCIGTPASLPKFSTTRPLADTPAVMGALKQLAGIFSRTAPLQPLRATVLRTSDKQPLLSQYHHAHLDHPLYHAFPEVMDTAFTTAFSTLLSTQIRGSVIRATTSGHPPAPTTPPIRTRRK